MNWPKIIYTKIVRLFCSINLCFIHVHSNKFHWKKFGLGNSEIFPGAVCAIQLQEILWIFWIKKNMIWLVNLYCLTRQEERLNLFNATGFSLHPLKIKGLLMSSGVTKRDQWYEMGLVMFENKTLKYGVLLSFIFISIGKRELMIQSWLLSSSINLITVSGDLFLWSILKMTLETQTYWCWQNLGCII